MRLIAFPQWDKLTSLLRGMVRQSAADYAQRKIVRIIPKNGVAHLANYAVNLLAIEGGTTTVVMPDMVPGKARDFMLRVTASGENELLFTGAEAFEGEEGALEPPGDGETVVYFITETSSDEPVLPQEGAGRAPHEKDRRRPLRLLRRRGEAPRRVP